MATEPRWISTPSLSTAFSIAQLAHSEQARKNDTRDPYISHLMAVAALVIEHGGTEEQAVIALLHDTIEDTFVKYDALKELVGETVADAVRDCSDTEVDPGQPKEPYSVRKPAYLHHVASGSPSNLTYLVKLADKTHNCESTARLWELGGYKDPHNFWEPFNAGDSCQETWYCGLALALRHAYEKDPGCNEQLEKLLLRFERAVSTLFDGRQVLPCNRVAGHPRPHECMAELNILKPQILAS